MIESRAATDRDPHAALAAINALSPARAGELFHDRGCGCRRWTDAMAGARPYTDAEALMQQAERAFDALGEADWREAFAAHSAIGAPRAGDAQGASEQSGLAGGDAELTDALREGNARYHARFGHVFLIRARGRTGAEMLAELGRRIGNSPEQELGHAAAAQREITELRLRELLHQ